MSTGQRRFDDDAERVFCLSMQRTGTTSVGKFFRDFGYAWAGWPADERNDWSAAWYRGDFEAILSSADFRAANAFEDSPWFVPDFYKVLFHRFPRARFVLLTRDPDAWFGSMLRHSGGNVIGRTSIHCKVYRRELEYLELVQAGVIDEAIENELYAPKTMKMAGRAEHYKAIYRRHNLEVQDFFRVHRPDALHVGALEDPASGGSSEPFWGLRSRTATRATKTARSDGRPALSPRRRRSEGTARGQGRRQKAVDFS